MSYKTILVHIDESPHSAARIRAAASIAIAENAHLIGAAMTGVSRYMYQAGALEQNSPNLGAHLDMLRQRAGHALAEFESIVESMGVLSHEKRLIEDDAGGGISMQASYCDLVVISQFDPEESSPTVLSDFPEYVLMHCGRPVLMVPYAGRFETPGRRVLIGWDASTAASRALTGAIPLLKRAQVVEVAVFNAEEQPGMHGQQPGADIALFLARHGITVDVKQQATDAAIGDALLSLAADLDSDLIVMGAYVHSRFRELLLGGVTRTVLQTMTVPVLMAH